MPCTCSGRSLASKGTAPVPTSRTSSTSSHSLTAFLRSAFALNPFYKPALTILFHLNTDQYLKTLNNVCFSCINFPFFLSDPHVLSSRRSFRTCWITATSFPCASLRLASTIWDRRWRRMGAAAQQVTPALIASSRRLNLSHHCTFWPTWPSRNPGKRRKVSKSERWNRLRHN